MIKNRVTGLMEGGGWRWAREAMCIKESNCCDECWVLYVSDELMNSTAENQYCIICQLNKFLKNSTY